MPPAGNTISGLSATPSARIPDVTHPVGASDCVVKQMDNRRVDMRKPLSRRAGSILSF